MTDLENKSSHSGVDRSSIHTGLDLRKECQSQEIRTLILETSLEISSSSIDSLEGDNTKADDKILAQIESLVSKLMEHEELERFCNLTPQEQYQELILTSLAIKRELR